jgi:hypothetical protein
MLMLTAAELGKRTGFVSMKAAVHKLAHMGSLPHLHDGQFWLQPANQGNNGDGKGKSRSRNALEREDLPFKVELWNAEKTAVEQTLAVTANGSIGYAAYYAATREFAERYITLRHKNIIVSSWNSPTGN